MIPMLDQQTPNFLSLDANMHESADEYASATVPETVPPGSLRCSRVPRRPNLDKEHATSRHGKCATL
jgi:hypothetical protein